MDNGADTATIEKSPADRVIETFGGLSATARAVGVAVTTVQGWKERRKVPQEHWTKIQAAARGVGKNLDLSELLGVAA